jgi:hypothetical protein
MVDLVPDANPVKPLLRSIESLAAYATTYRYPTSAGRIPSAPPQDRMSDWLDKVAAALVEAAKRFGVDLDTPDSPASRPAPIR